MEISLVVSGSGSGFLQDPIADGGGEFDFDDGRGGVSDFEVCLPNPQGEIGVFGQGVVRDGGNELVAEG